MPLGLFTWARVGCGRAERSEDRSACAARAGKRAGGAEYSRVHGEVDKLLLRWRRDVTALNTAPARDRLGSDLDICYGW